MSGLIFIIGICTSVICIEISLLTKQIKILIQTIKEQGR